MEHQTRHISNELMTRHEFTAGYQPRGARISVTYGQVVLCATLETCQNLFIRYAMCMNRPTNTGKRLPIPSTLSKNNMCSI